MEDQIMSLITDYIDGNLTDERRKEFDKYVAEGHISMSEIEAISQMQDKIVSVEAPVPNASMDDKFYTMLSEEKDKLAKSSNAFSLSEWISSFLATGRGKLALGFAVLLLGVFLGRGFSGNIYQGELNKLSDQMAGMQEIMMISMLEEESVTKRLQGVQMSSDLLTTNQQVTDAMFVTLNNDESTNVRMAALTILAEYADDPSIREGLINSISNQDSPLMQVALAELMVELQERKAVAEFDTILDGSDTPEEIKTTLRENLNKIM